jgi:hypothetical protein
VERSSRRNELCVSFFSTDSQRPDFLGFLVS